MDNFTLKYNVDRKAASKLLKVSVRTVDRYIKKKVLAAQNVGGRVWLNKDEVYGLIDRKNPEQALSKMIEFANYLEKNNRSGVIFPEGTRSRTGEPKTFHRKGLQTLIQHIPTGYVLPISINNSWKLQRYGMFPIPLGVHLKFTVHPFIKISDYSSEVIIDTLETQIKSAIKQ